MKLIGIRRLKAFTTVALTLFVTACGGPAKIFSPPPTRVQANVMADKRVNVDARQRATPVQVRLYLLSNTAAFDAADFFSLYEKDQQVLGEALVWREEMMLTPGELKRLDSREAGEARHLAVVAAFRNIDRATWRASFALQPNQGNPLLIALTDDSVKIVGGIDPGMLNAGELPSLPTMPERPQLPQAPSIPEKPAVPTLQKPALPGWSR